MKYLITGFIPYLHWKKATLHRQFSKISLCFSPNGKKIGLLFSSKQGKLFKFANRQIRQQKLFLSFKTPWNFLANLPAEAKGEAQKETANSIWWSLLEKVRTFFHQHPEEL